jgi:hypothetical protein
MHSAVTNCPIGAAILLLIAISLPAHAEDKTSRLLTNDIAVIILERLDKQLELHHSMMRSDLCQAALKRHDEDGDTLETIEFPDGKVSGLIKGWACIKPDGHTVKSQSMRQLER